MSSHARKGYYALQDYTVQYWFDHLFDCIKSLDPISERDKCQDLFSLAMVFLKSYGQRDKMDELLQAETFTQLANAIIEHLPTHGQERNSYLSIAIRTESLRQKIAKLDFKAFTSEDQRHFTNLHGPRTSYKCSKPWCDFFKGGLGGHADRQKYINEHEFPYRCAYQDCMAGFELGFSTEDELQKHDEKWHAKKDDANSFPNFEEPSAFSGGFYENSLHQACERGDMERVRQVLESDEGIKKIDTRILRRRGYQLIEMYPLGIAAAMGHKKICELLISKGANINIDEGAPLRGAAQAGHLEVYKFLISMDANVMLRSGRSGSALHHAARGGSLDICKLLLKKGVDINSLGGEYGRVPLHDAARSGHPDIIDLFLRQDKIEPNKKTGKEGIGRTAARAAAVMGQIQALRLMQASGKVDMSGVLQSACTKISRSLDTIKYLLNNGHASQADERCVWTVLGTVQTKVTQDFFAKVGLAMDMLLSTGNPTFSDVNRLATELGYEIEMKLLAQRTESAYRDTKRRLGEKRTPYFLSIMEYPKWGIKGSAWSKFLELRKKVGMEMKMDTVLEEAVNKFVRRIEDNRSTTIIDDEPKVKGKEVKGEEVKDKEVEGREVEGKGKPTWLSIVMDG